MLVEPRQAGARDASLDRNGAGSHELYQLPGTATATER